MWNMQRKAEIFRHLEGFFLFKVYEKKNVIRDIQMMKIAENLRARDKLLKKSKSPRISIHKQFLVLFSAKKN